MYSGRFKSGVAYENLSKGKKERFSRILRMHANRSVQVDSVSAGDIGVDRRAQGRRTGDTLRHHRTPVLLERMAFPEPVITVAIEPRTLSDRQRLQEVLAALSPRIRPSLQGRTRTPDSSSSPAWGSCTST